MTEPINMNIGQPPQIDWINLNLIDVDHNYQRELDERRVKKILREFHWTKFGALILTAKSDGRFNCTDGQHRLEAAKQHPMIESLPASISAASTVAEEAVIFLAINRDRKSVSPIEKYWAGLQAGDALTLLVKAALDANNCEVAPASGYSKPHLTNAVAAISRAITIYGQQAVIDAIAIIRAAWPSDPRALRGVTITALSRLTKHNELLSLERMARVMSQKSQSDLTSHAEAIRKLSGGAADVALTKTYVELYNKGISINTIEAGIGK